MVGSRRIGSNMSVVQKLHLSPMPIAPFLGKAGANALRAGRHGKVPKIYGF
jgi:hypothetical protein